MLLSLIIYLQSLKWLVPTFIMLGASPCYMTVWAGWRALTAILPRRYYRFGDDILYSSYQRFILFFFENCTGVELFLYGDTDCIVTQQKENVLYMSNHQCTVDWLVCDMVAVRQGMLGNLRYILKDGLRYFPIYGFYLAQHDSLYVKRGGKFNVARANRQLARLRDDKTLTWLIIFPEGTRFNPELPDVIEKSQMYASDEGYKPLNHVLTPRYKAVQVSLEQMRSIISAVYDVTIAYSNTQNEETDERVASPGMIEFLSGASRQIHVHLKRIDIRDVPEDEEELRHWLMDRFQQKEKLLSHFYSEGSKQFPGYPIKSKLGLTPTLPSLIIWGGLLAVSLATSKGRTYHWQSFLGFSVLGCIWMSIRS
ncbi:1-acyl-sn-glycerol-3-phosphate acyltransferase epsilon-like [Gigantopelta aegis]|uniref:1-acyl-sn-glycerol-3-phosphate acyltransferase epsilon-like n=1 Tax=Gigantopelta aegis TaxID=1735272 RepID=UPI001B888051|nr:1-acyl-sn-glycerol-3-phosphate acyltransferase epsilon-like [Gigantopelta aegis]